MSVWLSHKQLCQLFLEKIELKKYESFIFALERLLDLPYSKLSNQFLMKYRQEVPSAAQLVDIPPLKYDENNRPYMNAKGLTKGKQTALSNLVHLQVNENIVLLMLR